MFLNSSSGIRKKIRNRLYFRYNANVEVRAGDGNVPLNGDHTHFLMVDDGSRYRFFGKSTDFITRFEDMVRSPDVSYMFSIPQYFNASKFCCLRN